MSLWASCCGPCRKKCLPCHFQKVIGHDTLEVIAIDSKEPRSDFLGVLRACRDIDLTCVHDANRHISKQYGGGGTT